MPNASTYQCPSCAGVLAYDAESGALSCASCGRTFGKHEFERPIPLSDEPVELGETKHASTVEDFLEQAPWNVGNETYANAVSYSCPSCAAAIIADQSTVSTACPFCGNNMLVQGGATAENLPKWIMPFEITKDQAIEHMRGHFKHKWYLSRKFDAELAHMQGIYVPYYAYDLRVSGKANYIGRHEPLNSRGGELLVSYLAMHRAGYADISMLPIDASSKMPDAHMDAIAPFDFGKLKQFSTGFVAGFLAEVPDEGPETCLPRIQKRVRRAFEEELADDARRNPKVDALEVTSHKTEIEVRDVKSCALPVWLMHCTWEGRDMLFAVNGDTGRCVGDLPIDRMRRTITLIVGFAISLALSWPAYSEAFGGAEMPGFIFAIATAILLSPLLVDYLLKEQMKTAVEAEGDGLDYSTSGLVLTESWDGPKFHSDREEALADQKKRKSASRDVRN